MAKIGRKTTLQWIREDFRSNPKRFCFEVIGMISNLIASLILMWYSPNPPMFVAYIFFLIATFFLMYGAWSRRSFGFTFMYASSLYVWNQYSKDVTNNENQSPTSLSPS